MIILLYSTFSILRFQEISEFDAKKELLTPQNLNIKIIYLLFQKIYLINIFHLIG